MRKPEDFIVKPNPNLMERKYLEEKRAYYDAYQRLREVNTERLFPKTIEEQEQLQRKC